MPEKLKFTKTAVHALPPALAGQRVFYYDTETPGFAVQVTAAGSKTFYLYRRINGRPERVKLGGFPAVTVKQARKLATEALGTIATGGNPNAARRAVRAEWTLNQLLDDYLERHAKPHKKSWKEDEAQYRRYLLQWDARRLSEIRKADVKMLHVEIGDTSGHYAANRMLALLRGMFNYAIRERDLDLPNPAVGIKPFHEAARERRLMADELPAFFQAVAEEPNATVRDYILISLLTGARRANVLAMRWEEVHLDRAAWDIPAEKFKNGKPLTVHLPRPALNILEARQAEAAGPWVFPTTSATGHLVEPKAAWARILKRAGLADLRLHDLRRSLASWQIDTGASLAIVGKTLGHLSQATTAVYARLSQDPVRRSVDTAVDTMLAAAGVQPTADVVPLKRSAAGKS